jgi:hypothetical protein
MIPRIRELLRSTPFVPFTIRTSDGRKYTVHTPNHAAINPKGSRVIVFADDDSQAEVAALHVATVVKNGG